MRRVPSFSADTYAFGVSACEVATGIAPYSDRERNGAPVAVKRPKLPTKAEIDRYHVELRLMLELTHDHILPLLAAHARPPEYFLVFPYQENGSVASLVHEQGWRPSWPAVLVLLQQVASALAFVHARGYVHRDVKPSNVLLDARWNATLCDFGLAESEEALRTSLQNAVYSEDCLLYTSPSPRDRTRSRMPSSA